MIVPSTYLTEHRTERLTMRPLTAGHMEPWIAFLRDKDAVRYFPERGEHPEESAKAWIDSQLLRYVEGRFGLLALYLEDGTFIGQCGLIPQQLDGETVLEIGYHLFPEFWGNGYASEAATWFKNYAQEHKTAPVVVSIIHTDNLLSQAVARRNGMQPLKTSEWNGKKVIVFGVSLE